jgi:hypothetical protein
MFLNNKYAIIMGFLLGAVPLSAAKFAGIQIVDKDHIQVRIMDGEVQHKDDAQGSTAYGGHSHRDDQDIVINYTPVVNTTSAATVSSWTLTSATGSGYLTGANPTNVYRKTKLNGHAEQIWVGADYNYVKTYEHTFYLKLPTSLTQGAEYTLQIASGVNSDQSTINFTYDIYNSVSDAIKVNLVGYNPQAGIHAADLYMWMGDGGERNYSTFVGNAVYLHNVATGDNLSVGTVTFGKADANDFFWNNNNPTRADVWHADFSTAPEGNYRLVIEGVGCSPEFRISESVYFDPFMVSVKGFYYMRIGEEVTAMVPAPRQPRFIPGVSPANTVVYITTMQPWHPQWTTFGSGDKWDLKDEWAPFRKSGNPTNPNAWGGHSDALDWDRHLGHVSIIYDMLLPYILTQGAINDDNLGIRESGNGIADILDEARNEVDFWLRLRDGAGYSHGLNNPNDNNVLYQAGNTTMAAWANSANAAMLAECFRISGNTALMNEYRDSAIAAWNHASAQSDQQLNAAQGIGNSTMRGKDFKMTAAAYLYNVTGNVIYEQAMLAENSITSATSLIWDQDNQNQVWALAGYLMSPQTINNTTVYNNMKSSVVYQAKQKEQGLISARANRRATDNQSGYFMAAQDVHRTMVAHAVTDNAADRGLFEEALYLEADYGLGRNGMNMIQMTTASTSLQGKRSVKGAYTSGRNDGTPGDHPGHTPYMNVEDWFCGMEMGCPSRLYSNNYPANFLTTWPRDESYHNSRYVWAHNEFTPQQTMRGKMALYGYLYGIGSEAQGPVNSNRVIKENFRSANYDNIAVRGESLHFKQAGQYQIVITDIRGKTIAAFSQEMEVGLNTLDTPLNSGLYMIQVSGLGQKQGFKLLIR